MNSPETDKLSPAVLADINEVLEKTDYFPKQPEEYPLDKTTRLVNYFYEHLWDKFIIASAAVGGAYSGLVIVNTPVHENPLANFITKLFAVPAGFVGGAIMGAGLGLVGGIGIGAAIGSWKDMARLANRCIL